MKITVNTLTWFSAVGMLLSILTVLFGSTYELPLLNMLSLFVLFGCLVSFATCMEDEEPARVVWVIGHRRKT